MFALSRLFRYNFTSKSNLTVLPQKCKVIEIISFLEDLTGAAELYFRSPFVEQLLPLYFLVVHLSITDSVKLEIDRK